jgi:magnesium and cobalt transporter
MSPKDPPPFYQWLRGLVRGYKTDTGLREALEEYIQATPEEGTGDVTLHERLMLANVLRMRDLDVTDVMIPRADVVAIEANISRHDFEKILAKQQFVIGTLHIKDVVAHLAEHREFTILELVRPVPIVSPSLPVADLIMQMREHRKHMVMVVDEHGGIDGLVTIGDVIETIFGQIDDEYVVATDDMINPRPDGTVILDARLSLVDYESRFGTTFSPADKEENDTLGGLVMSIAGRVPARGELVQDPYSKMIFEVIDSDARRVYRIRLRPQSGS